jgi:phosphoribosylformylglycinamidine synthase
MVRDGTAVCPGSDAAVLRIKGDSLPPTAADLDATSVDSSTVEKYVAIAVDCNAVYVYLDPYEGGKTAVAEAARNLACAGAVPLGTTDNLNFGNPHNPEIFWQLRESVRGLAEGCRAFNAPITGGNVSLYNQSPNGPIDPTPTVAMAGLIEKPEHITTQWFKDDGDAILLLGTAVDLQDQLQGLGGSAYLQRIHSVKDGLPPRCDLAKEQELHLALRAMIHAGEIKSAHDCSDGGLLVALAESCISGQPARETPRLMGASIDLTAAVAQLGEGTSIRTDALLFGETQGRIIISVPALEAPKVLAQAKILGVPAVRIGTVGGNELKLKTPAGEWSWPVADLHDTWWNAIARVMK